MNVYTPIGYLAVSAILLAIAASPVFRAADASWHTQTNRTSTIDGLRGFLALGVFFHHAVIYHRFLIDGVWTTPPSALYTELGQASVVLFFMITGFLFWGKAIRTQARPGWRKLYISRVFRIAPVYCISTLTMVLIVFSASDFTLRQPLEQVLHQGLPLLFFGFFGNIHSLNGYPAPGTITAGVTWTLRYEWYYYLTILPLTALAFARSTRSAILFSALALLLCLAGLAWHQTMNGTALAYFLAGMCVVSLHEHNRIATKIPLADTVRSVAAAGLMLLVVVFFSTTYTAAPVFLLFLVFLLVTSGASVFGLLYSRTARRLGEMSYSIYLLHGTVLWLVFHAPGVRSFAGHSLAAYWAVIALASALIVLLSRITFLHIEKPGIRLGKRLAGDGPRTE